MKLLLKTLMEPHEFKDVYGGILWFQNLILYCDIFVSLLLRCNGNDELRKIIGECVGKEFLNMFSKHCSKP